ncbi:MAG TPA: alpha-L-arabinofuranosidase C-terminal domain-containing protein [Candidatus Hydrogenedentes bacterium]|nr:alpha-L-arabinofuranosidase C-terminal domain-containing protein [Candidatus Hydrogenedentota bacterium]
MISAVCMILLLNVTPVVQGSGVLLLNAGEPQVAEAQTVTITTAKLSQHPIDLKQCGQFIEPLCDLIPAMSAQQVENTSFEEEPPFRVNYKAEIDKAHRPWYPDGAVHKAVYSFDMENPFNGKRSQKIEIKMPGCRAGIAQDGFFVHEGTGYRLRMHLRSLGNVPVWGALHGEGQMLAGPLPLGNTGETWQPAEIILKPSKSCNNASLTIEFEGPGTLWVDRVYLIGDDAVCGIWRADVAEALKAMNPGVIRFGGSTMVNDYEWEQCIGPWDQRAPYTTCWGGMEPNFASLEEFIQLCQFVNAEPLICLRWNGKTPEDAAAQIEYCNGSAETPWGKRRAENGHPEPYGVRYWQVGNEVGGKEYDNSLKAFIEAMKKADPSIKVLSSFPSEETLDKSGGLVDYLCPHHYGCEDLKGKEEEFNRLQNWIASHEEYRSVRVAVTEWNTTAGDWGLGRGMLQTLTNALSCARYHNLMHRYAGLVEIAIRSNLVDSFGSGVIQTGPGWMYTAPTYDAQCLYARAAGDYPLKVSLPSEVPWWQAEIDLSVTLNAEKGILRIFAINSSESIKPITFSLAFPDMQVKGGQVFTLEDREKALCPEVMNSCDDPKRIAVRTESFTGAGPTIEWRFGPFSLTLLELETTR